ncbi:hypothetical protein PGO49_24915, partial [Klebsiella aerogenes]
GKQVNFARRPGQWETGQLRAQSWPVGNRSTSRAVLASGKQVNFVRSPGLWETGQLHTVSHWYELTE